VRTVALSVVAVLLMCTPPRVGAQASPASVDYRAAEDAPNDTKSATELNKELTNPISTLWSIHVSRKHVLAEYAGGPFGAQFCERAISAGVADITD
jgi:hypothetical protein